ncbi:MAG: hypothetical protein LBH47_01610 [Christensenellaceae bacterium]|jgi:hypothetical protein|nr:hypothetical protein [Christensenellaceae bacterium]
MTKVKSFLLVFALAVSLLAVNISITLAAFTIEENRSKVDLEGSIGSRVVVTGDEFIGLTLGAVPIFAINGNQTPLTPGGYYVYGIDAAITRAGTNRSYAFDITDFKVIVNGTEDAVLAATLKSCLNFDFYYRKQTIDDYQQLSNNIYAEKLTFANNRHTKIFSNNDFPNGSEGNHVFYLVLTMDDDAITDDEARAIAGCAFSFSVAALSL